MKALFCLIFVYFLNFTESATVNKTEQYSGKCVYSENGKVLEVLKPKQVMTIAKKCLEITCHEDLALSSITCPTVISPGCRLGEIEESKNYPDCCPKLICELTQGIKPNDTLNIMSFIYKYLNIGELTGSDNSTKTFMVQ